MPVYLIDLVVVTASTVLLNAGYSKIVQPYQITRTLFALWGRVRKSNQTVTSTNVGRMFGIMEVGLALLIVLGRSRAAGIGLVLFAVGLSVAGLVGILSDEKLPCACFGGPERSLGYLQVLQLPLWVLAAWAVARTPTVVSSDMGERTAMLALCLLLAAVPPTARLWRTVVPIARSRRQRAMSLNSMLPDNHGRSSW